jgi:hypothetical protein
VYESGVPFDEEYWFDFPEQFRNDVSESGNPWLACLLPVAATLGESLHIPVSVDPLLLTNLRELTQLWKHWFPHLAVVTIDAQPYTARAIENPTGTAAFFSGGVDSFFTVLRHDKDSKAVARFLLDDLLCVWGFDIPLSKPDSFARMEQSLRSVAVDLKKRFIDVRTNLRETRFAAASWPALAHGAALSAIGLCLERRYQRVLIGSTGLSEFRNNHKDDRPWGSHPRTDPLFSTSRTTIVHDGARFNRVEKTAVVAKSEVALKALRVCWKLEEDTNCGTCSKCFRTMLALHLLDALDRCKTFSGKSFDPSETGRLFSGDWISRSFASDLRLLAIGKGRDDIVRYIDRGLRKSRRIISTSEFLRRQRGLWRFVAPFERAALANMIV